MKIRAISMENSSLIYGSFSFTERDSPFAKTVDYAEIKQEDGTITEVWPSSIERFSGVLDCNRTEIYENDVVKPTKFKDVRNVVRFADGMFYRYKVQTTLLGEDRHYFNILGNCEVKIVGLAEDFKDTEPLKNWEILNEITGNTYSL